MGISVLNSSWISTLHENVFWGKQIINVFINAKEQTFLTLILKLATNQASEGTA